ncbi:triose-phosphate isomerase [Chromatiales bacterium (ex Bugula neritina AB1)]|nr:triose-phosphate isomerase [Chromatiales bacterium (ex Bugula neritina AB1)]
MRLPIVAGNWKLNGSRSSATTLAREIAASPVAGVEVVICPVAVHLDAVSTDIKDTAVKLGAQNAAAQESGAFTGEISAQMLSEYGCEYVIIGHSERRSLFGENEEACANRFSAVLAAGLTPIFCVGESLEDRESGNTMKVVEKQLQAVFSVAGASVFERAVIAYEPVWAIGTGKTATPEQAQEVHQFIRGLVASRDENSAQAVRILYGGSVNPGNASELFAKDDIDGGLIGGAALKSADFLSVCNAARL